MRKIKDKVCAAPECFILFTPWNSTQKACSLECALDLVREAEAKKAKREAKAKDKADRKAVKEFKRQDLKWQHKQTQKVFNRMRVLEELLWFRKRGKDPECISCGLPLGGDQWCCGHMKTRGAQSGLRYDRSNTFLQHNHRCNMNLSGDIEGSKTTRGYKKGLLERFGQEQGQSILDYCESHAAPVKWAWQDLEEMRGKFAAEVRELEKEISALD